MSDFTSRRWKPWTAAIALLLFAVCVGWATAQFPLQRVHYSKIRIVAEYPHDRNAFTQGLLIDEGQLLEGTGQHGESKLRRVDLETGQVLTEVSLPEQYFGEGIAVAHGELFQLTWKNRVGFVYDVETLEHKRTVRYSGEGWGLTFDGEFLILSDGSATLRFIDPETFHVKRRLAVYDGRKPISSLNELEYVEEEVWANIWYDDKIARIDPATGRVVGWIDLKGLKPRSLLLNREAVHNGIAYDPKSRRIFLTGKNWPTLYEVEIVP